MEKFGGKTGSKKWGIKNWEVRASKSSLLQIKENIIHLRPQFIPKISKLNLVFEIEN